MRGKILDEWKRPNHNYLVLARTESLGVGDYVGCLKCPRCDFKRLVYRSFLVKVRTQNWYCLTCGRQLVFEPMEYRTVGRIEDGER